MYLCIKEQQDIINDKIQKGRVVFTVMLVEIATNGKRYTYLGNF